MDTDLERDIVAAATRSKVCYRNGDDISGGYWADEAQRLSDQLEAQRGRHADATVHG